MQLYVGFSFLQHCSPPYQNYTFQKAYIVYYNTITFSLQEIVFLEIKSLKWYD